MCDCSECFHQQSFFSPKELTHNKLIQSTWQVCTTLHTKKVNSAHVVLAYESRKFKSERFDCKLQLHKLTESVSSESVAKTLLVGVEGSTHG